MRNLAVKLQRITDLERVARIAVTVFHGACQHVQQFGPWMLEEGKNFLCLGQGDEQWLHPSVGAAHGSKQLVAVPRS